MICYKDMTFCRFDSCKNFGDNCHRSLTKEIIAAAEKHGLPTSQYMDKPDCYESKQTTTGKLATVGIGGKV